MKIQGLFTMESHKTYNQTCKKIKQNVNYESTYIILLRLQLRANL